jgi:NADH-quinone oxidoreductase subunit M
VGGALVLIGSYSVSPAVVLLACASILLSGYYLFTMYRLVFLGTAKEAPSGGSTFIDLSARERLYLLPLVASLLFFGLYPKLLIELVRPTVLTLLSTVNR